MIEQHTFYHPPQKSKRHGLGYHLDIYHLEVVISDHLRGKSTSLSHSVDQAGARPMMDPYSKGLNRSAQRYASVCNTLALIVI